ncbi:MAG: nucleotide disphospho-sugar-binding domain-containing protein [Ilumatobacteraceae bacterium]
MSPDFASHYSPLAVLARAAKLEGRRVVVATGPGLRERVEADGFEWLMLQLGAGSNDGIATETSTIGRFIAATSAGPIATIRCQALEREHDLLWRPERVGREIADICDRLDPADVLVDHVSFGSTLAMYATGRPFVTLVPGHPSQLPVGDERYGVPPQWPLGSRPDSVELAGLEVLVDRVTAAFTDRWNTALATLAPGRDEVEDAFRVHGRRVLYNGIATMQEAGRLTQLPTDHRFVGPLVRDEALPHAMDSWMDRSHGRPQVYVALGTFLSHRCDVLAKIAEALRLVGARAAIALGSTPEHALGPVPPDWVVAPRLPQVAMLRSADIVIHHGGNNTVQEALASGARQLVLPFSTDQFANAADLERVGIASVLSPNTTTGADLAHAVAGALVQPLPKAIPPGTLDELIDALFDERTT